MNLYGLGAKLTHAACFSFLCLRAYIMEPDNLGGIIPPRKRIHYIAPRGDWLGSKIGGRINHPHKLIGLSVFCMADCGRTVGSWKISFICSESVWAPLSYHVIHSTPQLNFGSAKKSIFNWVTCYCMHLPSPLLATTWSDHVVHLANEVHIVLWGVFGRLRNFYHLWPPKQSRMGFGCPRC